MISTIRPTSVDQRGMFGQKPRIHPVLAKEQQEDSGPEKVSEPDITSDAPVELPESEIPKEIESEHEPTEEPLEELPEEIPTEEAPTTEPILEDSEKEPVEESPKEETSSTMTEVFECPNCDSEFDNKKSLTGHMLKYTRGNKNN